MSKLRRFVVCLQAMIFLFLCLGSHALSEDTGKDSLLVQAKESFSKGDCIEPIDKLHKVLELDSRNEEATLLLADSFACAGIMLFTTYYYWELLRLNHEKYENYYLAPYANELKPFKEAIEKDKKDAKAYFGLGQVYLKKAFQFNALADYYYHDLELKAEGEKYFAYLVAMTDEKDGDNSLLYKNFAEAIKIDPQYAEAYNALGVSYSVANSGAATEEKALKAFENAVKFNGNYAPAIFNLGVSLKFESGDPQSKIRAKELFLKAKELGLGFVAKQGLSGL